MGPRLRGCCSLSFGPITQVMSCPKSSQRRGLELGGAVQMPPSALASLTLSLPTAAFFVPARSDPCGPPPQAATLPPQPLTACSGTGWLS